MLDDLKDAADLDRLMPAGLTGRVLITTADAATIAGEPGAMVVAVPAFSIREALSYLSGRLTTDRTSAAARSTWPVSWAVIDLLPYGRQEDWQDSPEGWPQSPTYKPEAQLRRRRRALGARERQ